MGNLRRRILAMTVSATLLITTLNSCSLNGYQYKKNTELDTSENVRLVIVGVWTSCPGIESVAKAFTKVYPNCKVEYEYLQDYKDTLPKRLQNEEDCAGLFITPNIQEGSDNMQYAVDLLEYSEQVPLTDTFSGFTDNFKYSDAKGVKHLYSVPLGGEIRGLYVNKTLLDGLDIAIPTCRTEFLSACEKLREAGYIAIQDNPGSFGQRLLFPYIAHLVSRSDETGNIRNSFARCDESAVEVLRDPIEFLYNLTVENYYNYKYVETEMKHFLDLSDEHVAMDFLNVTEIENDYEKLDDLGNIPFMTATDSLMPTIDRVKADYHSAIEYEFILAPVAEEGGYAYLTPLNGIAVNKNTNYLDWALELISKKYDLPIGSIGQPKDVTFDEFNFYNLIYNTLLITGKANNPKYMQEDGTMYPLEYYMDELKAAFTLQRNALGE